MATFLSYVGASTRFYCWSVIFAGIAVGLKVGLAVWTETEQPPFLLLFIAIAASAWFGGVGPGLTATLIAAAGVVWVVHISPHGVAMSGLPIAVWIAIFICEGAGVSLVGSMGRRARLALEKQVNDLRTSEANLKLQASVSDAVIQRQLRSLRSLARNLTEAEHREKQRLACVLHDHLQQLLVAAKMRLRFCREGKEPPETIEEAERLISESLALSRTLVTDLCPPVLEARGLAEALHWLADQVRRHHRVDVKVRCKAVPEDHVVQLLLFDAARETLSSMRMFHPHVYR
jgi:signal transduction histidine kinase